MAAGYRDVLLALTKDHHRLQRLSAGALRRAAEYAWPVQGERMRDYYREVLGDRFVWTSRGTIGQPSSAGQTV
jgi:hypothetical protein